VEGERYLDFLRFCVWVNGESVEENANLVIRLLIRRPECLGPALRGEGEGLLKAIVDANKVSLLNTYSVCLVYCVFLCRCRNELVIAAK